MIINTESIKEYMYNSGHLKISNPLGSIDPLIEWEKWLSYELNQESVKEVDKKRKILKIIKKYNRGDCSYDEYKELSIFLNKPIDSYMIEILNKEELSLAKRKINVLKKISDDELSFKVDF